MQDKTIGTTLRELRQRASLSLEQVAKGAGYRGRSSIQQYFHSDYNPDRLDAVVAEKLCKAFVGKGDPAIARSEIMALVGLAVPTEVIHIDQEMPTLRGAPRDLPVYGTVLGADLDFAALSDETVAIEQTLVSMMETITYVRRPPAMSEMRQAYALFVVGSSMEPRYGPGDPVFVDPVRPPAIGDDVVVQLIDRDADGEGRVVCALIKTLRRRSGSYLELEQYEPRLTFRVPASRVAHLHRIISMKEAFFG
ncbi:hypothetical protein ASE70_14930 [Sphingomonas sp. Leaf22]|nr:hypothetical protein ASE70_14930 [Sphingomonas sp. Leaf22]